MVLGSAGSVVSAATAKATTKTNTSASAAADDKPKAATGGGSVQGYASDTALQYGTLVQLTGKNATSVAAASSKNPNQMYGVTVDPHQLSLTISNTSLKNEVYVATSGTYSVLVSNQGGVVKAGDYITISDVDGVAMNAGSNGTTVFGRAASSFDGKNNSVGNLTLKDTTGKTTQTVSLGQVLVAINIQRNPNEKSTKANLPKALQRIGEAIADKPIGPLRIYLSIGITGLSIIVALVTLYAGIRNSLIAIGRNPLSKRSIFRALLEVILTGFLILIIGLFAVYLLLKL